MNPKDLSTALVRIAHSIDRLGMEPDEAAQSIRHIIRKMAVDNLTLVERHENQLNMFVRDMKSSLRELGRLNSEEKELDSHIEQSSGMEKERFVHKLDLLLRNKDKLSEEIKKFSDRILASVEDMVAKIEIV